MNMIAFLNPLLLMIITSGARSYYRGIKLQLQLQEVQTKQYQAELDLLRFQINPHFFFNTLNNLFSMARKQKDESTSKGIAKLSHIMRYIIYDCNVDKIELEKEIDMINNFIELQKLRFSDEDDIKINFGIVGELQNQEIAPMLLVPFVENAFKHGISLKNMSPINIKLKIETETLIFSVRNNVNKLRYNRENEHSGIGLQNVKRRLELLYPNKHELLIENIDDKFDINLKIDL
ncbi:MAG: histidine kinase [Bacteroidetes bacterium]|nr:histidine kinase [Bacteroidota bacterium]MBU1115924.1 histidine kinase [Bacteroidota bacterium]MBU1798479.1 histidine kinase [Bacteroidota bacterium]